MDTMNFEEYGELDWLEPEEFYAGSWSFYATGTGDDGDKYDIVIRVGAPLELRYTCI